MSQARHGQSVPCAYCRLPVPGVTTEAGDAGDLPASLFCCYGCRLAAEISQGTGEEAAVRWMLIRVGTAIFLTLNLMVFTMALWTPDVYGPTMSDSKMESAYEDLFRHLSLLSAAPVMLMLGPPLARSAWAGVRAGRPGSDLLVVVGVWAAFGASMYAVFAGEGPIYFEVACVVLIFVTLGRWLEASGKLHTQQEMDALADLLPETALVIRNGQAVPVPVSEIKVGDSIQLRPGDRIPCDAVLEQGEAAVDEQIVTGESRPITKSQGHQLLGGSLVTEGSVVAVVSAAVDRSTIARLIEHVRHAREIKGKYARMADRVATWLLPLAIGLALCSGILHTMHRDLAHGLLVAMSVLLIACPCAVGLATPLAVWSAMGEAAKKGILFADAESLERLAEADTVLFDKTGTLTTGRPTLSESIWSDSLDRIHPPPLLTEIASRSSHPMARTLSERWIGGETSNSEGSIPEKRRISIGHVVTRPGRGLIGYRSETDERPLALLGSPTFLDDQNVPLAPSLHEALRQHRAAGRAVMSYYEAGEPSLQALFAFDEDVRPDTRQAIERLRSIEPPLRIAMITGDHRQAAERLAGVLGIEAHAQMLPEAKQNFVRELQKQGHRVIFVGEGYNDAPAMVLADVGIALGAGADLTRDNASVCIMGDNISAVPDVLELSVATVRRIRRNLFWAFFYNIIGLFVAAAGLLSPTLAAAIMFVSSLAVVAGASRPLGRQESQHREPVSAASDMLVHA